MSRIFLTSSLDGTKSCVKAFLEGQENKTVVFIPTAAAVEGYTGYIESAKNVFVNLGCRLTVLNIEKTDKDRAEEIIDQNSIIYISGGNSFYLLQELKRKNLDTFIKNRVLENKLIYIGESAGAIIASRNIDYCSLMDDKKKGSKLVNFSALSLVEFYTLPHYKEFPFEESAESIINTYGSNLDLKPINNHEAIIVIEDHCSIWSEQTDT